MLQQFLNGSIPPSISNLYRLEVLQLSTNILSGPLPDLSNCSNLRFLGLEQNKLTGGIPNWVGVLPLVEMFAPPPFLPLIRFSFNLGVPSPDILEQIR